MARESSNIPGFLDDYSLLAQSFIDLYQATFDEEWLELSLLITSYAIEYFYDESTGMFFYAPSKDTETITNKTEISDNVIPSSNSVMANLIQQLSVYFEDDALQQKSDRMLNNVAPQMIKNGAYFSNWASLMCNHVYQLPEVVFTGAEAIELRKEYDRLFTFSLVAGSVKQNGMPLLENRVLDNESLIYVCRNRVCKLPVDNVNDALLEIANP